MKVKLHINYELRFRIFFFPKKSGWEAIICSFIPQTMAVKVIGARISQYFTFTIDPWMSNEWRTCVASVGDVFDGVFVIKLCEDEGLKMLVHHIFFLNVDRWLALAATVGMWKKVPVGWAHIWRWMRRTRRGFFLKKNIYILQERTVDPSAFMLHTTVTIIAPLGA